jgi:hypothetical protein
MDALEEEFAGVPSLFFIDPFGIEPLKADLVRRALARPNSEVLLLFADQAALRHYGIASALDPDATDDGFVGTLFDLTETEQKAAEEEQQSRADAAIPCIEIMNAAFDGEYWLEAMQAVPQAKRRERVLELYAQFLYDAGAARVLVIPIRNESNRHVYHLIHATKSKRGYRAMKESLDAALNRGPLTGSAADTIRFLLRSNLAEVEAVVRQRFAGMTVPWTSRERGQESIRLFALENTPIHLSELPAMRQRLNAFKTADRKWTYAFPSAKAAKNVLVS